MNDNDWTSFGTLFTCELLKEDNMIDKLLSKQLGGGDNEENTFKSTDSVNLTKSVIFTVSEFSNPTLTRDIDEIGASRGPRCFPNSGKPNV